MKNNLFVHFLIAIVIAAAAVVWSFLAPFPTEAQTSPAKAMIKITSPAFSQDGKIPVKYTCDGSNANPSLSISGVPDNAQSLAIIVDDPDAPNGTFNHWVAWNIDPKIDTIQENKLPSGAVSGTNSAGKVGYVGPCPPSGTHRYIFTEYALDTKLDLGSSAKKEDLLKAMEGHVIGQGELTGKYSRVQ